MIAMWSTVSPTSPTLQNEAFAELVLVVLAGVIIVWCLVDWLRGR